MAVNKSKADLLSQAATTLADNTTQAISPQDVREMAENLAESNFNKTTDNALVGLKAYDSGVIYKVSQGVNYNGSLYFANKDTTPGAFNTADWDLFAEQSNVVISGKKASAGTIAKGKPVYLVGFDNDLHTVEEANASAAGTTPVIGFTAEPFNTTDGKNIITFGKLDGIDTSAFSVGDDLYLATSAGGLTTTRPTGGGSIVQRIAKVLKSHATGGQILIYNTARAAGLPNITANKIWYGNTNGQPEELGIGTGLTVTGGNLTAAGGNSIYTADGNLSADRTVNLNDNKITFDFDQSTSAETAPINFEFGGGFGGYYSRWDDNGGLIIKSAANAAFKVVSKVDAAAAMFYVGKEGGGFMSTNGNRLWTIADETTSTTKNEFNDNKISQYFAGTEYHRIQTGGGAASGAFFHIPGFGSLGGFIVGAGAKVASEDISLQGKTLIKGADTLGTSSALQIYDGDSTPALLWDFRNNGDVYLLKETTIRSDFQEMLTLESSASNPSLVLNALNSGSNTNIEFAKVNSKKWLIGNVSSNDSFRIFNYQTLTTPISITNTNNVTLVGNLDMSNKRITNAVINPSVQEAASSATFTINADEQSDGVLTAMAAATTIAAPTGSPVQSQSLVFRFKDDGTARGITWNAIFRAIGVTLPTTTTASKLLYVGCKYNSTETKWDVVSVQEEA